MTEVVTPRRASTVLVVRDSRPSTEATARRSPVEVFMLRRVATMAFAPRMMVFPGGGVDARDADVELPWAGPSPQQWARELDTDEASARELVVAAVREVFEECGVLLAGPNADTVISDVTGREWHGEREGLLAREQSFAQLLIRRGLVLRSDLLRPHAHWITPEFEPRRYDTHFFVALLPEGQVADDLSTEADHAAWTDPRTLLDQQAAGEALMLPPTIVAVEQVAAASSAAAFLAQRPRVEPIMPELARTDAGIMLRCALPPQDQP
ncbi:MAG TPA: NUDIX hydrolase [Segeticoccus sp.]|uniref:NUDIX hydrolase n=1 Tax=Segeticoccus sp. TaxID=2706531 RepID=UPI002D7FCE2F|nr:NUDIX hydrolase [Segeticoccus sp.]HET8599006.1 NUDIX hydrolase [Segeticoccus sp.]